jgi:hypothetical protein
VNAEERRRNRRFVLDLPVTIIVAKWARMARLKDVCRDAALVEADRWEPLRTEVGLRMLLPGTSGPLQVSGRVIRLTPGEQGTHGMAILFSGTSPEAEALIAEFVAAQREG